MSERASTPERLLKEHPVPRVQMIFDNTLTLFAVTATVASLLLLASARADACDYAGGWDVQATLPAADTEVGPEVRLSIWRTGQAPVRRWRALVDHEFVDDRGEAVEYDTQVTRTGVDTIGEVEHLLVVPDEALEPGSYHFRAALPDTVIEEHEISERVAGRFELSTDFVVTSDPEDVSAPSVPEVQQWTRIEAIPSNCHPRRSDWNDVALDAEERDDVWYEIQYQGEDQTTVATQPSTEPLRHHLRHPADCITVRAVAIDGTRSDPVEVCTPDAEICERSEPGETHWYDCSSGESIDAKALP